IVPVMIAWDGEDHRMWWFSAWQRAFVRRDRTFLVSVPASYRIYLIAAHNKCPATRGPNRGTFLPWTSWFWTFLLWSRNIEQILSQQCGNGMGRIPAIPEVRNIVNPDFSFATVIKHILWATKAFHYPVIGSGTQHSRDDHFHAGME